MPPSGGAIGAEQDAATASSTACGKLEACASVPFETPPGGLCVLAAADCAGVADCVDCRTSFAGEFCRDVACPFIVNDCGFVDEGQCGIDCDNVTGGALGCFQGHEIPCCTEAAADTDCSSASADCTQLAF